MTSAALETLRAAKWFWGTELGAWRLWGMWIADKWFIGFSVVKEQK